MQDKKDWLYEWKKMMCNQIKEVGVDCINKHGIIINNHPICKGCPYEGY